MLIFFLVFGVVPSRGPKKAILTEFRIQNVKVIDLKFQILNFKFMNYEISPYIWHTNKERANINVNDYGGSVLN